MTDQPRPTDAFQIVPKLVSLEEAASVIGCSVRTLRRRVWKGEIVATRIDRIVRIRVDDLRAYLDSRRDLGRQLYRTR